MDNKYNEVMLNNAIVGKVDVALVDVTPAIAQEWMECNVVTNRKLKRTVVQKYASDMMDGKFGLNPDAITFNTEGELVNGQHRLTAVIKANKTVKMFVVFGFPITKEELLNVDTGAKRTVADNMELAGIDDEVFVRSVSTARMYLRAKRGIDNPSQEQITAHIKANYNAYADVNSMTKMGRTGGSGKMQVVVAAAILAAYMSGESHDALAKFCKVYREHDIDGCDGYNTKIAEGLRDVIKGKGANSAQVAIAESHINAFARNSGRVTRRTDYYPVREM